MLLVFNADVLRRKHVLFSINRFDPAKRVETAVNAFAELCKRNPQSVQDCQLIIAGLVSSCCVYLVKVVMKLL